MTLGLLIAALSASSPAFAQDEEPEPEEVPEREFEYTSDKTDDTDWKRVYRQGRGTALGGAVALWIGEISTGVGFALAGDGCAPVDGVCTGDWLGDGFMVGGTVVAFGSTISLASGSLRARKALIREQGLQMSALPGTLGVVFWLAGAGTAAASFGFAKPTEALPPMPYVSNQQMLVVTDVLFAVSYIGGVIQYAMVSPHRADMAPSLDSSLRVAPYAGRDGVGLSLGGRL